MYTQNNRASRYMALKNGQFKFCICFTAQYGTKTLTKEKNLKFTSFSYSMCNVKISFSKFTSKTKLTFESLNVHTYNAKFKALFIQCLFNIHAYALKEMELSMEIQFCIICKYIRKSLSKFKSSTTNVLEMQNKLFLALCQILKQILQKMKVCFDF